MPFESVLVDASKAMDCPRNGLLGVKVKVDTGGCNGVDELTETVLVT